MVSSGIHTGMLTWWWSANKLKPFDVVGALRWNLRGLNNITQQLLSSFDGVFATTIFK